MYKTHLLLLPLYFKSFLDVADFHKYTKEAKCVSRFEEGRIWTQTIVSSQQKLDAHGFVCLRSWIFASEASFIITE